MKKMICMVLFLALLFSITACAENKEAQAGTRPAEAALEQEIAGRETDEQKKVTQEAAKQKESGQETEEQEETAQETAEQETAEKMKIQVGDTVFTVTLAENSSVDALKELMEDGPLTLEMSDYAGMEKGADLGVSLPQNNVQMNTQAGDVILYQGRTFVIYYDTNSWSLTPIGKIDNVDAEKLKEALGTGDVTVTLSLE